MKRVVKFTRPLKEAACFFNEAAMCLRRGDSKFRASTKKNRVVFAREICPNK